MNKQEFSNAVVLAQSNDPLENVDIAIFEGCALPDFEKVTVTLRSLAKMIRYQALLMNGEFDSVELNNIAYIGRRKFTVVG